jgi:hypothetical protein
MPNRITVWNGRTVWRKFKIAGIIAASLYLIYSGFVFASSLPKLYKSKKAHSNVMALIGEADYFGSIKALDSLKVDLKKDHFNDLEYKINAINPDNIINASKEFEIESSIHLLENAYWRYKDEEGYNVTEEFLEDLREAYLQKWIDNLTLQFELDTEDFRSKKSNKERIGNAFDNFLRADGILFRYGPLIAEGSRRPMSKTDYRLPPFGMEYNGKIDNIDLDDMFKAESKYIKYFDFGNNSEDFFDSTECLEEIIIKSLAFVGKIGFDENKRTKYVSRLLETYGRKVISLDIDKNNQESKRYKLAILLSLRNLEDEFDYKVYSIDVKEELYDISVSLGMRHN